MAAYLQGQPIRQGRVGLLPAAFNPPTRAHLGLAEAAQVRHALDQVVFVLPEAFPHKDFEGTTFDQRVLLLKAAIGGRPEWALGTASGGLFLEIAREFRELCGPGVEIYLLCGRDAGIRIVNWDYGSLPTITEQLAEYQMIVAARHGEYQPPPEYAARIHPIDLDEKLQAMSSSEVRDAVRSNRPWRHMVPPPVADLIASLDPYR